METFAALAHGMAVAVQPMNLLYALIGVFLGTAVGVLPGIGPALTVALLLPVTYKLDPGGSLIMFAGIYYGGMYGGSTTAILINTPGESASIRLPIARRPRPTAMTTGITSGPMPYIVVAGSWRESHTSTAARPASASAMTTPARSTRRDAGPWGRSVMI